MFSQTGRLFLKQQQKAKRDIISHSGTNTQNDNQTVIQTNAKNI